MRLANIFVMAVMMTAFSTQAQGLKIYMSNGTVSEYRAADVEKIVFLDDSEMPDGVQAVDLGLSVKWASCNLGATDPQEYGDFYAWAETSPKETYSWATYKYAQGDVHTLTKYNNDEDYGMVDNINKLEDADDAAMQNLGPDWHIPTRAEWEELEQNCVWTWDDAAKGYKVTGRNGNSIFLPANGIYNDEKYGYGYAGEYGYYMSSDLNTTYWYYEDCYAFYGPDDELDADHYPFYVLRCIGIGVRPVKAVQE